MLADKVADSFPVKQYDSGSIHTTKVHRPHPAVLRQCCETKTHLLFGADTPESADFAEASWPSCAVLVGFRAFRSKSKPDPRTSSFRFMPESFAFPRDHPKTLTNQHAAFAPMRQVRHIPISWNSTGMNKIVTKIRPLFMPSVECVMTRKLILRKGPGYK